MATMGEIEEKTRRYAIARKSLADKVQELEEEITALKKKYLSGIKKAVEVAATYQAELSVAIEESPELFDTPRTVVFYGIKIGYQKGKGVIEWEDDEQVVKLIEKHFPEQADVLIKTTKKPMKKALSQLTVAELKKLGIIVEETGDMVVIRPTDSEVDKLVAALLKDEIREIKEAA